LNKSLYVLVVEKAGAKLFKSATPQGPLSLVYHQVLFGDQLLARAGADDELVRGLCRLLRADRQLGKYGQLVMIGSDSVLAALRRQYDGDWDDVSLGYIAGLPARYTDEDLAAYVHQVLE
jgi:hypothetical protein